MHFLSQVVKNQMKKLWVHTPYDAEEVAYLHQTLKINPIFCQLLVQRNIKTYEMAERFFRPDLNHLHDPFLMKGMEKAVRRIVKAIIKKEKILVYGDYDVDGTTSVALMYLFLKQYHEHIDFYIPDRSEEGYGVSMQGVEYAAEHSFSLILSLDCGIKAVEQVKAASEKGIDFIICDHHLPEAALPNAVAVLNPKQKDCPYPYKELSACAVGFKLAQAFALFNDIDFENLKALLDLVVVSLACDLVPLTGENRVLAHWGLERLNNSPRVGFEAIRIILNRAAVYSVQDIVFGIGPMINAAGRLEHAKQAVNLLIEDNKARALEKARQLATKNQKRREIQAHIVEEALALVEGNARFGDEKATVLYKEDWHKGVIGIVASRMMETYYRPTIVLTKSRGKVVGSARSVGGFDIHEALNRCGDLLLNFGGHKYAAGLTLEIDKLVEFKQRFEHVVQQSIVKEALKPVQIIDAEITLDAINPKFWKILKQFAPFGPGNMRPVFLSKSLKDTGRSKLIREQHIQLIVHREALDPMQGIAFNFGKYFGKVATRRPFQACYVVEENAFRKQSKLRINVKDLRF